MHKSLENLSNHSGIYIILNIIDCKVYVGQSVNFNNRDHIVDLENGSDNSNLQKEYDDSESGREFIYFVVANSENKTEKVDLDFYEKLYMTLFEDLGYKLYNKNISKNMRTLDVLGEKSKAEYCRAKQTLFDDFISRFHKNPQELLCMTSLERENVLEKYVEQRLNRETLNSDRFLFNRKRIRSILGTDERSVLSLNIDEMFISKAGNYIGEGIDQILAYEQDSINKNNYCLWTFASNAVHIDTVKTYCMEREKKSKDTYVLFSFTPSSVYASAEAFKHSLFRKKYAQKLSEKQINFLNFDKGKYGHYFVPEDIDCTAADKRSSSAFVIQELFLIEENIRYDALYRNYKAIKENGAYNFEMRKQASTFYIKANDDKVNIKNMFENPKHRSFCFIGKLAAPYVIKLEKQ